MLFAAIASEWCAPPWGTVTSSENEAPEDSNCAAEAVALMQGLYTSSLHPYRDFKIVSPPTNTLPTHIFAASQSANAAAISYASDSPATFASYKSPSWDPPHSTPLPVSFPRASLIMRCHQRRALLRRRPCACAHMCSGGLPLACVHYGEACSNIPEMRELYGVDTIGADTTAQLLLDLYMKGFSDSDNDDSDQPATALASLQGNFCFLLLDASNGKLLVGRTGADCPPLYWGTDERGMLLFSSDQDSLSPLVVLPAGGASLFPCGVFYESCCQEEQGRLVSFARPMNHRTVNAVSRINSHGQLCGLGFHTQSGTDLCNSAGPAALLYSAVGWRR